MITIVIYNLWMKGSNKQTWYCYWPNIWSVLFPTIFPTTWPTSRPKHSTSVPSSAGIAVPLSVDENEVAFVPNPVPVVTVKGLPDPQGRGSFGVVCGKEHSMLPPTFQRVSPVLSPVTLHLKVKVSPGQVGGGAVNCPSPGEKSSYKTKNCNWFLMACTFPWMKAFL